MISFAIWLICAIICAWVVIKVFKYFFPPSEGN